MTARAAGDTAAVLAAHDFSSSRRIVDVGGGRGHLLHAVLEATPQARGILFDLPGVVEAGGPAHPRLIRQAGDFFVDPLPAAGHLSGHGRAPRLGRCRRPGHPDR